jgi:TetR/AcrR family transcriptional regulator, mexJK operon transcriptional repressor
MLSKNVSPKMKKSEQTRAQALLEAERLYSLGGYEAINLQTIAEAIGVTKAALFYHFESKQVLFVTLLDEMLVRYNQMIGSSLGKAKGSSEAQFLALSLALSKQPMFDAFRFLRSEQQHLSAAQQAQLQRSCNELLFRPIKRAFTVALERGEIPKINVNTASSLFLSFCVLASSMRATEYGALSSAGHKEMFAMFWHGVASHKN